MAGERLENVVQRLVWAVNEGPGEDCPFCEVIERQDGSDHDPECLIEKLMLAVNYRAEKAERERDEALARVRKLENLLDAHRVYALERIAAAARFYVAHRSTTFLRRDEDPDLLNAWLALQETVFEETPALGEGDDNAE